MIYQAVLIRKVVIFTIRTAFLCKICCLKYFYSNLLKETFQTLELSTKPFADPLCNEDTFNTMIMNALTCANHIVLVKQKYN